MADYDVVKKTELFPVYGEQVEIQASVAVCKNCGTELFNEELDSKNLLMAQNLYRKKHKLLTAKQIIEIREQYGLSQRAFAKLLDWGDKTIRRYEAGAVQSKAHNSLLLFLQDPQNMNKFLKQNEITLDEKQLKKLRERVALLNNDNSDDFDYGYISNLFPSTLSLENGYKEFDFDKFASCVLYFIDKLPELLIVKLNKLLNYTDMLFFKQNGVSLTGTRYVHLPYGPVPDQYSILYGMLEKRGIVTAEIEQFENGYEKHLLKAGNVKIESTLTQQELLVLEEVNKKFASFGSKQIADYSHNERGYKETKQGDIISYAYAEDIEW
jgi:putative zinc finger/helix-turn-helix YgiT family protein